jgi:hypothetical protein
VFPSGRSLLFLRKCRGEVGICHDANGWADLPARPSSFSRNPSIEIESELHILTIGILRHAFARRSRPIRYHNSLEIELACNIDHGAHDFPVFGTHVIAIWICAPKNQASRSRSEEAHAVSRMGHGSWITGEGVA